MWLVERGQAVKQHTCIRSRQNSLTTFVTVIGFLFCVSCVAVRFKLPRGRIQNKGHWMPYEYKKRFNVSLNNYYFFYSYLFLRSSIDCLAIGSLSFVAGRFDMPDIFSFWFCAFAADVSNSCWDNAGISFVITKCMFVRMSCVAHVGCHAENMWSNSAVLQISVKYHTFRASNDFVLDNYK